SGQRMGSALPKQYIELAGIAILQWSLAAILSDARINKVVVCIAENDNHWDSLPISKDPRVMSTPGGDTRAESVLNGLDAIASYAKDNDWALVHDAARPCLSSALLNKFIDALIQDPVGGILAMPCADTLKQSVPGSDRILKTLARDNVWLAQTPQMFRYRVLGDALRTAMKNQTTITDEASAIEGVGLEPRLIQGSSINIKVTTTEDLVFASAILSP
ncbi:MAG: 2-C-methyl-D-erythritol 4-phosphate cytidylyltransferase, partial [Arenicella sp.]|nr:2-C-methyl-D-erythritol 4-phosphate cytidylyltransferase [Arenicella sp.]